MSREMCRICLTTSNLTPLFNDLPDAGTYYEFLCILTGLEIKSNDQLPQSICLECKECVTDASNLRRKSQQSHQRLLDMGFGKTEECRVFEDVDVIKCEFDDEDENSVFSDSCEILPIKKENTTNHPPKVKNENKKIRTKIKNKPIQSTHSKIITLKKPIKLVDSIGKIEESVERDSYKKEPGGKLERRQTYLNLVKGEFDPTGPVQCNICNKTVSNWSCFTSHVKIHLGIKFVCEHCGKKFVTNYHMNRHCRSQHGMEKVLSCPHCAFKAIDRTMLKHHTRREHTGERPYICDYCSASYFSRRCLIQHIDSHLTSANVQCEQCSQFFKSRRHLSRHKFQAHTCKLFLYQCPICKQVYKSVKYLRVHMLKVHSLSARDHKIIKIKL